MLEMARMVMNNSYNKIYMYSFHEIKQNLTIWPQRNCDTTSTRLHRDILARKKHGCLQFNDGIFIYVSCVGVYKTREEKEPSFESMYNIQFR